VLSQPKLINSLLALEWDGVLTAKTPLPPNFNAMTEEGNPETLTVYLHIIGCLSYIAVGSRPDIAFAVNYLARFSAKPLVTHWKGLKHLINYIAGSPNFKLCLYPSLTADPLKVFCDALWGGEASRPSYGFLITFSDCPVLWVARQQTTPAASTFHAEYMALGAATRHTLWVQHLLQDILHEDHVGLLHCDNQAAVKVSTNDLENKQTRHTNREFYITNDALFKKLIKLTWVPTDKQLADVFTKSLGPEVFRKMRSFLLHPV
jgi:hypothetical protein